MKILIACLAFFSFFDQPLFAEGSLKANFIQYRHLNGIPKPIKSKGYIVLCDGKGLIWSTQAPFPNTLLISEKGIFQLENHTKVPVVEAGGNRALFEVMAGIFTINRVTQVEGFTVTSLPSNDGSWRSSLTPQHRQVQSFIQSLVIEGDEHIHHITITRPNGDYDEITLTDHDVSPEIREWFNE